jgi:hypothetical protein
MARQVGMFDVEERLAVFRGVRVRSRTFARHEFARRRPEGRGTYGQPTPRLGVGSELRSGPEAKER